MMCSEHHLPQNKQVNFDICVQNIAGQDVEKISFNFGMRGSFVLLNILS